MAARKNHAAKAGTMPQAWRERIKTSMIVNRLMEHVNGKLELSPTQVSAANILLKKVAPDLQSLAHGQDPELGPVQIDTIERPPISREEWLRLHAAGGK